VGPINGFDLQAGPFKRFGWTGCALKTVRMHRVSPRNGFDA